MATTVAILEAKLVADTMDFDRAMDKSEGGMGKVGKAAGIAGLAIAAGLGVAAKIGFDEMIQGEKVTAQTNAVLESTGGIANVTAKEIDNLSGSLMKKSGVDDEAIASGANMLLTFTKVRNEVGAGNDIFNQATEATLNLSVAMGKDMSSSAVLVGKALNDPIKGIGALSRVGVQLSEDQKALIKDMVALGDTAGAQKVILKELETQFGGSAEAAGKTMAGQVNIAKESFANMTGQLVNSLMPAFTQLIGVVSKATTFLAEHETATKFLVVGLAALAVVLGTVSVATSIMSAAQGVAKVATVAWTAAQWLLNAALTANPIGLVILALVALGVGLVVAYQKSETFREIVKKALDVVKDAGDALADVFRWFRDHSDEIWKGVQIALIGPITVIKVNIAVLTGIFETLQGLFNWFRDHDAIWSKMWSAMKAPLESIKDAFEGIASVISKVIDGIKWLIDKIPDIPDIPKLPGWLGGGGTGPFGTGDFIPPGPIGPGTGGGGGAGSSGPYHLDANLQDEATMAAAQFAYQIQTYNPASTLPSGGPSDHALNPPKAFDAMFSPATGWGHAGARAFFNQMIGRPGIHYAILGDKIWSTTGGLHPYTYGGHDNHVHVSGFDKGGWLQPGWTMAYNGTGAPEAVGGTGGGNVTINVSGFVGNPSELGRKLRDMIANVEAAEGRRPFGGYSFS